MKLHQELNAYLANHQVLYIKLHNLHWYLRGPRFFTLHGKYEDLYNHVAGLIDDIAERLLIIGGKPVASLAGALKLATIQELEDKEIKADDTVKIVLQDIQLLAKQAKQVIEQAESEHDHATEDMIVGHLAEYQKWTWMLQSNLAI